MISQVWIQQINGGGKKIKRNLLSMFSKGLSVCLLHRKNHLRGIMIFEILEIPILRGLILRIPQSKPKLLGNVKIENK